MTAGKLSASRPKKPKSAQSHWCYAFVTMHRGPLLLALIAPLLTAQTFSVANYAGLRWREIGPFRGGRTVGAAGIAGQPNVFYIGVNNGGVWKTDDFGRTWKPIFDDQPTGSIGAIAIAPSDSNTIYVGSGEGLQRPDLSGRRAQVASMASAADYRYRLQTWENEQGGRYYANHGESSRLSIPAK